MSLMSNLHRINLLIDKFDESKEETDVLCCSLVNLGSGEDESVKLGCVSIRGIYEYENIIVKASAGKVKMSCDFCCKAEGGNVTLKQCPDCDLAHYCSDECRKSHRCQHEAICKERAAELAHDEILFTQPKSSHLGDCLICLLPLSLDRSKFRMAPCCSKYICHKCDSVNASIQERGGRTKKCPFCRKKLAKTEKEIQADLMKRVAVNDAASLREMGVRHYLEEDYDRAVTLTSKAARLGDAEANFLLATMYRSGHGVEKDDDEYTRLLEKAAIAGHPEARYNLGLLEGLSVRFDRAVKHWIIATNLGHSESMKMLRLCYNDGLVSKDDFAEAVRVYQALLAQRNMYLVEE